MLLRAIALSLLRHKNARRYCDAPAVVMMCGPRVMLFVTWCATRKTHRGTVCASIFCDVPWHGVARGVRARGSRRRLLRPRQGPTARRRRRRAQPAARARGRGEVRGASEQRSLTEGAPLCVGTSDRCVGTEDSCVGTEEGSLEISSLIPDEALKRILSGDGSLKCDGLRRGCASTGGGACVLPCYPGSAA